MNLKNRPLFVSFATGPISVFLRIAPFFGASQSGKGSDIRTKSDNLVHMSEDYLSFRSFKTTGKPLNKRADFRPVFL